MSAYKSLRLTSVNFGYVPTNINGGHRLWVDVKDEIPQDLRIGQPVRLDIDKKYSIAGKALCDIQYKIDDIIGKRVVIKPINFNMGHGIWGFSVSIVSKLNYLPLDITEINRTVPKQSYQVRSILETPYIYDQF